MSKLTNDELKEMIRRELMKEGIWDSIKHGLSKLPNLERNKWSKANKESAAKIAKTIEDNAENAIGKVANIIKTDEDFAGFPNMKSQQKFLMGAIEIATAYDTLKSQVETNKMDSASANEIISGLRELVSRYLDYDLKDVFKHFKEDRDKVSDGFLLENQQWLKGYDFISHLRKLSPQQQKKFLLEHQQKVQQLNELFGFGKSKTQKDIEAVEKMGPDDPEAWKASQAAAGEKGEEKEAGPEKYESLTMKGLESKMLPMMLAAGGASAVLSQAGWLKELFFGEGTTVRQFLAPEFKTEFINATSTVVEQVQPGDGFTQVLGKLLFEDGAHFNQNMPISQFFNEVKGIGITPTDPGPLTEMFANESKTVAFWTGQGGGESLQSAVQQLGPNGTIGQLFGKFTPPPGAKIEFMQAINMPGSITPLTGEDAKASWEMAQLADQGHTQTEDIWHLKPGAQIASSIMTKMPVIVMKVAGRYAAKTAVGAGAVAAVGATTAGAVAAGLGLGAVVAGAAVLALRQKGLKSSRAQVLNDLLQSMQPVKATTQQEVGVETETEAPSAGEAEAEATEEGGLGTIHIYRPGGEDNDSLSQVLKGIGIPRWAHDRVTARIKKELETSGFEVLQEATRKLKPLPMKQRKKPSGKGVRGTLKRPWAGEVPAMIGNEPKSKSAKDIRGATPRDPFAGEEDEMDLGLAPDEKPAGETKSQRDKRLDFDVDWTEPYDPLKEPKLPPTSGLKKVDRGTSPEKGTFKISNISDILKGVGTDLDDEAVTDPVPQEKIRPTMKAIAKYLGPKLKQAGIKMRESVLLDIARDIILEYNARQNKILQEHRQLQRWKKISGILKG